MFKTLSYAGPSHLALHLFSSGKHSTSAKLSTQGSLKYPPTRFAHLCMGWDHAGPMGPLAGLRGGGPPSGSGEPGYCVLGDPVPVTRSLLDADFPPPASSWPSAFFIHGWHCLLLDPDIRRPYLRPRHRAGISAIVTRDSRQCVVPERTGLSDHADLGVNCGSTVCLQGVRQFTELLCTSASFSFSRNLQSALQGLWVTSM